MFSQASCLAVLMLDCWMAPHSAIDTAIYIPKIVIWDARCTVGLQHSPGTNDLWSRILSAQHSSEMSPAASRVPISSSRERLGGGANELLLNWRNEQGRSIRTKISGREHLDAPLSGWLSFKLPGCCCGPHSLISVFLKPGP